jgi:hypothetical protein
MVTMTDMADVAVDDTEGRKMLWSFDEPAPWNTTPDGERRYRVGLSLMAHVEVPFDRRHDGSELCVSLPVGKIGSAVIPADWISARKPMLLDNFVLDHVAAIVADGFGLAMSAVNSLEAGKLSIEPFQKLSWMGGPPDETHEANVTFELPDASGDDKVA